VTAVHQFVPTLTPRDAVSAHYLAVQAALRGAGYRSDLFAWEAKHELRKRARPYKSYRGERRGEPAWLMYHSSVGSPVADFVLGRPEPLIVDYHNITPASFFMRWEPLVVGQLHLGRRQLASLAPRADLGLADSSFNAGELRDLGCRRTDVLPIMFDVRGLDRPADPALVERLHTERARGGSDWLFVGRIAPNKAQHDVVKAFVAYRRFHDPRARLHLVGGSSSHGYETALREYISALDLDDSVHMTGPVSDAELSAYYDTSDVLVVCSEHEGFCVPLLEAMFHDLPIVAYASSAIPETLGDAGLLLESKEPLVVAAAVDRVLSDADLRKQMIEAGRARLDAFDLSRSRATLLEAISTVVGTA
jgi:glycosyltransferase involved in cell wall biosynthesis